MSRMLPRRQRDRILSQAMDWCKGNTRTTFGQSSLPCWRQCQSDAINSHLALYCEEEQAFGLNSRGWIQGRHDCGRGINPANKIKGSLIASKKNLMNVTITCPRVLHSCAGMTRWHLMPVDVFNTDQSLLLMDSFTVQCICSRFLFTQSNHGIVVLKRFMFPRAYRHLHPVAHPLFPGYGHERPFSGGGILGKSIWGEEGRAHCRHAVLHAASWRLDWRRPMVCGRRAHLCGLRNVAPAGSISAHGTIGERNMN